MAPNRYAEAHKNPKGPGDARPTSLQIIHDQGMEGKLVGKTILITGCSSGLGIETARALLTTGATVFVTARNLDKGRQALGDILDNNRAQLVKLDLMSLASVRECAAEINQKCGGKLNLLICNAGVRHTPEGRTKDGFEIQFGTNHVGHFLLFQLLKSALLAAATPQFPSRVVCVSSTGHRNVSGIYWDNLNMKGIYNGDKAYGQSKLANIYMATEIERRYGAQNLHGLALHPGGIRTGLQHPDWHDTKMILKFVVTGALPRVLRYMKNPEQGAATTVWAAIGTDLTDDYGKYLEDCSVSLPMKPNFTEASSGYAPTVYDQESAKRLWKVSCELVGIAGDDN